MSPLEWELRLHNEVSAAAKQAGLDLREFGSTVQQVKAQLEALTKTQKAEGDEAAQAKKKHENFFGDVFKAEAWIELLKKGAEGIKEIGESFVESVVDASDFDYAATVALTHMTGSAEAAEDVMQHARAFSNGTAEDIDNAVKVYERFAAVGIRGDNLTRAADAAKDLAAVSGQSFDTTAQLFEMIGSDRGLGGRAVQQLYRFPQLLQELERHFGFVPGTERSFKQLQETLTETPIKGAAALNLLENEIMKIAHEGALGDVSEEMSNTIGGGLVKLRNDWKMIWGDLGKGSEFDEIRKDLNGIADYFAPANAGGKQLASTMKEVSGSFGELFKFVKDNPDTISGIFSAAASVVKFIAHEVEGLLILLKKFQEGAGYLGALVETGSFKKAGEITAEARQEENDRAAARRQAEAEAAMTPEERKARAEGDASFAAMKPRDLGSLPPLPSKADGGTVQETGLVTVHAGEEIRPASVSQSYGGGGGAPSIGEVHVHVTIGGAGPGETMDEQLLATKLKNMLPGALISAFEQMNQQRGGL